jgi:hypothetical protein
MIKKRNDTMIILWKYVQELNLIHIWIKKWILIYSLAIEKWQNIFQHHQSLHLNELKILSLLMF